MQQPKRWTCDVNGLCVVDGFIGGQVAVELCRDGVALRKRPGDTKHFIPTEQQPAPGLKVAARIPLAPLFDTGLVERREPAGCGLRVAAGLARRLCSAPEGVTVRLLNSGTTSTVLDAFCKRAGLECLSLGRQPAPHNLVLALERDRLILRDAIQPCPPCLSDAERQQLVRVETEVGAAVSASPRDVALTAAAVSLSNGSKRYFQATGSLPPEMTFLLLSTSHVAIANLDEWLRIGRWAGLSVPECGEESLDTPSAVAALLRGLKVRHWAGSETAIATLGRHGAVLMSWLEDRACHVTLEMLDHHPGVPTPVGAGDLFLSEWIYHQSWASRGHLRNPLAALGMRVTHSVATALGLRHGNYDVRVVPL